MKLFLLTAASADSIDLSADSTKTPLDNFVALGILTASRETAILATPAPTA